MIDCFSTENTNRQGAQKRGGGALAGDIAQSERETPTSVGQKIVEVAAELARRNACRGEIDPRNVADLPVQQLLLNFTRHRQVPRKAQLALAIVILQVWVFWRRWIESFAEANRLATQIHGANLLSSFLAKAPLNLCKERASGGSHDARFRAVWFGQALFKNCQPGALGLELVLVRASWR